MPRDRTPRCLTIATSDSGGGAGIQADIKAFAAAGCHGASVVVAVTAQNTTGVSLVHALPPSVVTEQLHAVFDDLGIDAMKTGALVSADVVETVASFLDARSREGLPPLVVDPVVQSTTGKALLDKAGVDVLRTRLLPHAAVVTPNDAEAIVLAGNDGSRAELAERLVELGAGAVVITGGAGAPSDHVFDGREHLDIAVQRVPSHATHGGGCTHSATLCAELAKGRDVLRAARIAAMTASAAIGRGLDDIGRGEGPVDVIDLAARRRIGVAE
ncbi:MAG: bifunctional hydroxymethylpyrimidine kinase/phosphomethylpyrimidine kinase [Candidatus Dormibacteraeota bacterium]|nr:bifunctional hydroxymethylpyrimidine kinase/phosphomethylpyrimidine kinase [Candidatus Dormibacteraeota bacterium]